MNTEASKREDERLQEGDEQLEHHDGDRHQEGARRRPGRRR